MADPRFGITFNRDDNESRPVVPSDMSVIGLLVTAPDADPEVFPLDTPVAIQSTDPAMILAAGAGGTLKDALRGINDQLGDFQVTARVVVVRVEEGEDDDATIANMVGDEGERSGIYAFLRAGPDLAVIPRLIAAPGFTAQHDVTGGSVNVTSGVKAGGNTGTGTLSLASPAYGSSRKAGTYQLRAVGGTYAGVRTIGSGNAGNGVMTMASPSAASSGVVVGNYRVTCIAAASDGGTFQVEDPNGITVGIATVGVAFTGPVKFTIADGAADFAVGDYFTIAAAPAIPSDGGVFSVTDPDGVALANATVGVAYDTAHLKFTINDGGTDYIVGDGFDVVVAVTAATSLANPVLAAAPSVLERLLAHMVADGPGLTDAATLAWRETISSDRIIPIDLPVYMSEDGDPVLRPGSPRVLGIAVRRDYETGGVPSRSWANQAIQGIVGLGLRRDFALTDGDTEGQTILGYNVGIAVRGEMNVESAAGSAGFIFIGTDNAGEDELWRFYNVTRMRDYVHLGLLRALRFYLGRFNINRRTIDMVLNAVSFWLRDLAADDYILRDYRVGFEVDKNSPENLRAGRFRLFFQAEEPPVLRRIVVDSRRNRVALERLMEDLLASFSQIAA